MTAFVANNGADNYFDAYTGGSVNATLDSYTISAGSRLIVRTDTYCCPNHERGVAEMSMRSGHMAYFLNARRLMGVHFDGAKG